MSIRCCCVCLFFLAFAWSIGVKLIRSSCKQVRVMYTRLHPTFIIVKLGFTGVFIFLIFALKHRLWVLVRTASLSRNKKNITIFHLKIIIFTAVKYWCILHGRVFVMYISFRLDIPQGYRFVATFCFCRVLIHATPGS